MLAYFGRAIFARVSRKMLAPGSFGEFVICRQTARNGACARPRVPFVVTPLLLEGYIDPRDDTVEIVNGETLATGN